MIGHMRTAQDLMCSICGNDRKKELREAGKRVIDKILTISPIHA